MIKRKNLSLIILLYLFPASMHAMQKHQPILAECVELTDDELEVAEFLASLLGDDVSRATPQNSPYEYTTECHKKIYFNNVYCQNFQYNDNSCCQFSYPPPNAINYNKPKQPKEKRASKDGYCQSCHVTSSSLWRSCELDDGSVIKLCNACGLRFKKNKYCEYCNFVYTDAETKDFSWIKCQKRGCEKRAHISCHLNESLNGASYYCNKCSY